MVGGDLVVFAEITVAPEERKITVWLYFSSGLSKILPYQGWTTFKMG